VNNELTSRDGPVVSVLMPVFNGGQLVGRAVDSILAQTLTDFELIVIDDGSTDETSAELSDRVGDPRLRVVTHDGNHGLVASLNEGLALCRAELVARLDADDSSSPTRLARQVAVFRTRPQVVLCASAYDRVDPAGRLIRRGVPPRTHAALAVAMLTGNRALHSTAMFRRDAVRDIGGYRDSWFPVEDYDLWLRLLEVGEFEALTTSETTYMAERSDSISSRWSDDQGEQAWRRSQRYFEELVGERPSDVGKYRLRVRDVSRASSALRRRLERRGIPTTGLDRQALTVANWMLREQSRLRRAVTILVVAPRLAISGRLAP
jgi:glycosyltransferase involved in cell wall biosynthesis